MFVFKFIFVNNTTRKMGYNIMFCMKPNCICKEPAFIKNAEGSLCNLGKDYNVIPIYLRR